MFFSAAKRSSMVLVVVTASSITATSSGIARAMASINTPGDIGRSLRWARASFLAASTAAACWEAQFLIRCCAAWRCAGDINRSTTASSSARPVLVSPIKANFQRIVLVQLVRIFVEMHQPNMLGNCLGRLVIHVLPQ